MFIFFWGKMRLINNKYETFFYSKLNEYQIDNNKYVIEKIDNIENRIIYNITKRLFDLIIAIIAIILLFIPMLIISIFIRCDSKGPIFYKQERLGKNGKPFNIIKFRSMIIDAEKDGARWASKEDERVTRVGKFLRNSRLDELPQLFNIILGQMSFVGPRPEREFFYNKFRTYIDGFEQRLLIIPGLTGFAQINGGYDLLPEEKIIFDIEYIKKRSVIMDLKLIFETILVVFSHDGAR